MLQVRLGDILQLKKPHPCGSNQWEVVRLGVDIGIKCVKCQRRILLGRGVLERRLESINRPN